MFKITGDFGTAIFDGTADNAGNLGSRIISLTTEASLNFFERFTILRPNPFANALGKYSILRTNRNKVKFASLSTPRSLFQSRKDGCVWNPKGKVTQTSDEIELNPIEYNGEECPDAVWGDYMEYIFGGGNNVRDMFATPESSKYFGMLINRIYDGLGISFYNLLEWGGHALIDAADAGNWYTLTEEEWTDFKDQQSAMGGHMSVVDGLQAEGLEHLNIDIDQYIQADGSGYNVAGSAQAAIDEVIEGATNEMRAYANQFTRGTGHPIIEVDRYTFKAFKDDIITRFDKIPESMYFYLNDDFKKVFNMPNSNAPVSGVLMYDGYWILRNDMWSLFDGDLGIKTFRIMMYAPGNFALPYDTEVLKNTYGGVGFRLTQRLLPPFQGKVYMDSTFKLGAGILDSNFLSMGSKVLVPA